ncbi:MAG: DNA sulfur modification protein DndD [Geminocystis sp.]|nr:DNA sulfur modification protein DndD [Geminocystis sp.]HIK36578.1 DNA sulfur modification protein DndD [Geminocystis sp. M7585_C2015_104]MCS7148456.1 DNA sulfur modification protein DndD [Geminocystis sp.]MCX8079410.1 DNA sulfur modification protein DndD [Geminocystis sp.]MDW8114970.1 DNA sulfur modification protein DndD [Geminocystis sp.]
MIIFKQLVLENFGPYRGRNTINLAPNEELGNSPIILIGGLNGGGKTTILDAIKLALYGKRAEYSNRNNMTYREFLLQCINRQIDIGEYARVELAFEYVFDKRHYHIRVIRFWDKIIANGTDNLSVMIEDYPDVELTDNWDEYVETIIPAGLSNLYFCDGERIKNLAERDFIPSALVKAIKSIIGLEIVDRLVVDLDVLANRKKREIFDANPAKTTEVEKQLRELENEREVLLREELEKKEAFLRSQEEYNKVHQQWQDFVSKNEARKQEFTQKIRYTEKQIHNLTLELKRLAYQYLPLGFIKTLLEELEAELQHQWLLKQLEMSQNLIAERDEKLISFLKEIETKPEIISAVDSYLKKQRHLDRIQLQSKKIYLPIKSKTMANFTSIVGNLLPRQMEKAQIVFESLETLEEELLATVENSQDNLNQQYETLQQKLQDVQHRFLQAKSDYEYVRKRLDEVEGKIEFLEAKLDNYSDRKVEDSRAQHILENIPKIKETLAIFQERLTYTKLNKLESEVTTCFRYLLHKNNLIGRVCLEGNLTTPEEDNLIIQLYNLEGKLIPKQRLSAGEKQILATSLLWALTRISEKSLPVVIDTPLARLDSSHRQNLVQRYFPSASHQVILLSTDTEIGKEEVTFFREKQLISREYILKHDSRNHRTVIQNGYFW